MNEKALGFIVALVVAGIVLVNLIPFFTSIKETRVGVAINPQYMTLRTTTGLLSVWFMTASKDGAGNLDVDRIMEGWFPRAKSECISGGACAKMIKSLQGINYDSVPLTRCVGGGCTNLLICMYALDEDGDGNVSDTELQAINTGDTTSLAIACLPGIPGRGQSGSRSRVGSVR